MHACCMSLHVALHMRLLRTCIGVPSVAFPPVIHKAALAAFQLLCLAENPLLQLVNVVDKGVKVRFHRRGREVDRRCAGAGCFGHRTGGCMLRRVLGSGHNSASRGPPERPAAAWAAVNPTNTADTSLMKHACGVYGKFADLILCVAGYANPGGGCMQMVVEGRHRHRHTFNASCCPLTCCRRVYLSPTTALQEMQRDGVYKPHVSPTHTPFAVEAFHGPGCVHHI